MHAGGEAVASVYGMLQRDGIDRPFDGEEADRQNIDPIAGHTASLRSAPAMLPREVGRGNRREAGLIASATVWQDETSFGACLRHGLDARDRQQELFVVVDAAVGGAESLRYRLR